MTAPTGTAHEKSDRPEFLGGVGSERRHRRPNSWGFLEFDVDQGSWPRPATIGGRSPPRSNAIQPRERAMANLAPFQVREYRRFHAQAVQGPREVRKDGEGHGLRHQGILRRRHHAQGHKIKVHLDEENITHVIIPLKSEVEDAEKIFESGAERVYPDEYKSRARCRRSARGSTRCGPSPSSSGNTPCGGARSRVRSARDAAQSIRVTRSSPCLRPAAAGPAPA